MGLIIRLLMLLRFFCVMLMSTCLVINGAAQSLPSSLIMGYQAGSRNTYNGSLLLGYQAGMINQTGAENTLIGYQAGAANVSGSGNTFVGYLAGSLNTGQLNTFIGQRAGASNTTGELNVAIGANAGANTTTGKSNMFLGSNAGGANKTGVYNVFIGEGAGFKGNTSNNVAIGLYAGNNFQNENDQSISKNNVAIGSVAGGYSTYTSNSIFIGNDTGIPQSMAGNRLDNVVVIGSGGQVTRANSVILGNSANVGIGTSAPNNKLELVSTNANMSGLRLTNLRNNSPATVLNTNKFLTVDGNGDVILGSTNGSARIGAEATNWQVAGTNLMNTNAGSIVIGPGITKTPVGYRLFVSEGILTEKVKVAVANTADWADDILKPTYPLLPLPAVERHIQQHGHLPGIPSASEVVAQGIDLAKMDAQLLGKIEELTLYLIRLQKQVDRLEKEHTLLRQSADH